MVRRYHSEDLTANSGTPTGNVSGGATGEHPYLGGRREGEHYAGT